MLPTHHTRPAALTPVGRAAQLAEQIAGIMLGALVVVVLLQVISRYILRSPLDWTADGATILVIWVSFLGAAVAGFSRAHFTLDFIVDAMPLAIGRAVTAIANLLVVLVLVELAWLGTRFAIIQMGNYYASIPIPKGIAALAIPVAAVLMIPRYLVDALAGLRLKRERVAAE